ALFLAVLQHLCSAGLSQDHCYSHSITTYTAPCTDILNGNSKYNTANFSNFNCEADYIPDYGYQLPLSQLLNAAYGMFLGCFLGGNASSSGSDYQNFVDNFSPQEIANKAISACEAISTRNQNGCLFQMTAVSPNQTTYFSSGNQTTWFSFSTEMRCTEKGTAEPTTTSSYRIKDKATRIALSATAVVTAGLFGAGLALRNYLKNHPQTTGESQPLGINNS
ncbi:MAG: hypothetical protein NTU49_08365, partial [Gammaproteobacteria bacterium]|nr:hypothetical protein [Gammaproteobacteria bacterium]